MNRDVELHDSDESDSDFSPDKEAGIEVSEEDSTELSSCSDDAEEKSTEKSQRKRTTKTRDSSKKQPVKKLKSRKRANAQEKAARTKSDSDDEEYAPAEIERKRNTRQTDAEAKRLSSCREKDELESDEEDKSRSDALWADFLSDVKPNGSETKTANEKKTSPSTTASSSKPKATTSAQNGGTAPKNATKGENPTWNNTKEKPTAANGTPAEKIKLTEILDFAGEEVRVEKEVNADSVKENKATPTTQHKTLGTLGAARTPGLPIGLKRPMAAGGSASGSGGGLGSLLSQIGKKKKISVLEKSQLDWKSFKQNEGIEEELQTFNKGRDGYLERQDFLQRTDLRQFEIEKNLRQSKRNN